MKTQFKFCDVLISAVFLAAIAFAAPSSAAAPAPYNWTGVYVGINGSYGWGTENWQYPQFGDNANQSLSGGMVGGTLGWNFLQTGPFVFGLEGDFDWADINGSRVCPNTTYQCYANISDFGTLRGRAGYAVMGNHLLLFGTAGTAGALVKSSYTGSPLVSGASHMNWGWTVGAGAEYAFADTPIGSFTAKLEYLYVDLGNHQITDSAAENLQTHPQISMVRAGVNYKF
jgi:outer membrane immunogenic protein